MTDTPITRQDLDYLHRRINEVDGNQANEKQRVDRHLIDLKDAAANATLAIGANDKRHTERIDRMSRDITTMHMERAASDRKVDNLQRRVDTTEKLQRETAARIDNVRDTAAAATWSADTAITMLRALQNRVAALENPLVAMVADGQEAVAAAVHGVRFLWETEAWDGWVASPFALMDLAGWERSSYAVRAYDEHWTIFECNDRNHPPYEIQADDDNAPEGFDDADAAWLIATVPAPHHYAALVWLREHSPEEYGRIVGWCMARRHGESGQPWSAAP